MCQRPISGRVLLAGLVMAACLGIDQPSSVAATPVALGDSGDTHNMKDRLILHYSFDDDSGGKVYDESGNGNHGATVGNVAYESSFRGRAPKFTSRATYIACDSPGINMHGWKQTTVSVWIKTNRITTYGRIISRGEVTGEKTSGIRLRAGSGAVKASWSITRQFGNNPPTPEALHTSSLMGMKRVGKWVHLVGTFDGKFLRLYVNGKRDREAEVAGRNFVISDRPTQKLVIGNAEVKSRLAWYDKYFDGLIDEVKIWKRSLSDDEIAALYDQDARDVAASLRAETERLTRGTSLDHRNQLARKSKPG